MIDSPFRCPTCGAPDIAIDGDPFSPDVPHLGIENVYLARCDNAHSWFEGARFAAGGRMVERATAAAGTPPRWERV